MRRSQGRIPALLLFVATFAILVTGCASFDRSTETVSTTSDPSGSEDAAETGRAVAALRRMSGFLASRPALRFESEIYYDAVQESGQKVEFGSQRRVELDRPNRARFEVLHSTGEQELTVFDGRRLSASLPEQRVYASVEYAGTLGEAFDRLETEYGVASPLLDLLRPDLVDDIADRVLSARHVADVEIEGTPCDQLAFRGERLDFQIYIRNGAEPVPMRLVIDYHGEPGSPQFRAQMRSWDLAPAFSDTSFRFLPPAGAQRVAFSELLDLVLGPLEPEEDE